MKLSQNRSSLDVWADDDNDENKRKRGSKVDQNDKR